MPPQPEQPKTPQFQQQPSQPPPSTTPSTLPSPNLNPKPQQPPQPKPALPTPQPRPAAAFSRTWQQQLSQLTNSSSSSSPSVTPTSTPTLSSQPRGNIPSPSQPTPFSGSFGHSFTGASSSNVSHLSRPPMQGIGIGSHSQMRPPGISAQHQQRPLQSSLRPPSSSDIQSPTAKNFQGHGLMRVSATGSSTPSTSQTTQATNQPWLSSGSQGKPPLPPPSSATTACIISTIATTGAFQATNVTYIEGLSIFTLPTSYESPGFCKSKAFFSCNGTIKHGSLGEPNKAALTEGDESGGKILSKRSIHDLVNQIDPSEKLDPEVEDILVDIAEDFVDSITTFGCSLAKHRKSDTLEAKDILLHLERNWNTTLPGFTGDEIKTYRKPHTNEVHKERLAAIKKSILVSEASSGKHFVGQAGVNAKGNHGKAAANTLGSPNVKIREVT
ncbi:Transcription initiation factor TFIID subunit 12 [Hibiscus syriacus]|uniref:Transcription initiation factor TFIID subunit 12 n=1 Tax=Hibiscus syriacus TaxID=106335 RepID=A0A6A2ZMI4_HIBSY|nr:Transcription initiation factor TFIID subunit 12 [Hibiscus syriacus]